MSDPGLETFLLANWGEDLQFLDFASTFDDKSLLDTAELGILLSANKNNYERYFPLVPFVEIFKKLNQRLDLFTLQKMQICALNLLLAGLSNRTEVARSLELLRELAGDELALDFINGLEIEERDKKEAFAQHFDELNELNIALAKLAPQIQKELDAMREKFESLEFNIAITGVMNAGKSSLLNELFKKDFLGVSNVPETANLTAIKYGEEGRARIKFWDKDEWEEIQRAGEFSEDLRNFLEALAGDFRLDEFIKNPALMQEISLDELKNFSSAQHRISALIKEIELYSPLAFLKNKINIIDTPGLDDVLIARELLTRQYLRQSDFVVHLMNAAQSLTQKDADFLIHTLLSSRVNKLLIVLSKIDLLAANELDEVKNYVRQSLRERLEKYELENVVEKIDFLCVSARKGVGIEEFEKYIFDTLYGGEKSQITLSAYKKELLLKCKEMIEKYELENLILRESGEYFKRENQDLLKQIKREDEALKEAKKELKMLVEKIQNSQSGAGNLMLLLAKKLKERLIDELKYLQGKKLKINMKRIMSIVDITVRDGVNDLLREIKLQNTQKMQDAKEALAAKYDFLRENFDSGFEDFKGAMEGKIEELFSDESFALFKLKLEKTIKTNADLFVLENTLSDFISESFEGFNIERILKDLNLNKAFFDFLNAALQAYENKEKERLKELENLFIKAENRGEKSLELYEKNEERIASLNAIKMSLENAN